MQIGWRSRKSGLSQRLTIGVCYNKKGSDFENHAKNLTSANLFAIFQPMHYNDVGSHDLNHSFSIGGAMQLLK